ncbi:cytochrome P450 [Mollisia scopiformis]|uniref:Cytochrome P450 n=1 Tax=Mollisia scopiformis TaxID=149040 RepID=A0A194XHT2_MOLSC|nr:cytochrome P450 [Mollisia scopiformis]KUJ19332.1 cytochrome P450 [Mollisia scopiformis]
MVLNAIRDLALNSPLLFSGATLFILISVIHFLLARPKKLNLPIVGGGYCKKEDHRHALVEGTLKYPDSPFLINTDAPLVILPISVINEVRNLPEDKASFMKDMQQRFASKHTQIGSEGWEVIQVLKVDLTRHIASTLDDLQEEIQYGFDKEFGPCEDWTPIPAYHKLTRIIALLSGRVFVGRPLSRDEEWIQATVMSTMFGIAARDAINSYPRYLRDIVAPFLPELKRLKQFRKRGAQLLKPILDAQLAKEGNEKLRRDDSEDEQGTIISWMLKYMKEDERCDPMILGRNQIALSMAAIHTSSMATTSAIYDLAAHPEYIQPLRDEIHQVIDEDGQDIDGDGHMTLKKSSMPKLWKLDSFLKESQRFTPPQLPANVRVTTSSLTLSTGHTLPTGTRFAFSAWAIHNSPTNAIFTPTPDHTPLPPSTFDGFRFYKLRRIPGNENKHLYVTTSPDSLNFGHGNHACPGRFFASNEIKVILIELLRSWEFRYMGGGEVKKPENTWGDMVCYPDLKTVMEFRRRKPVAA